MLSGHVSTNGQHETSVPGPTAADGHAPNPLLLKFHTPSVQAKFMSAVIVVQSKSLVSLNTQLVPLWLKTRIWPFKHSQPPLAPEIVPYSCAGISLSGQQVVSIVPEHPDCPDEGDVDGVPESEEEGEILSEDDGETLSEDDGETLDDADDVPEHTDPHIA